ncbi:MAG: hypothetical protein ACRERX_09525 [Pseudomonas sp.]
MIRRYWRHALATLILLVLAIGLLLWSRATAAPSVEHLQLTDGSPLTLVKPGKTEQAQVALAVPAEHALSDAQLLARSRDSGAQLLQLIPQRG